MKSTVRMSSPYAAFNLFRNPFGELTREERAELAVVDAARWIAMLVSPVTALQFIGPCGHGKSTHLLAIERHCRGAAYIYLPENGPQPPVPGCRPLLIDEAQRLSRLEQRRLFRKGGPFVLGTHEDLTKELMRAGLEVTTVRVAEAMSAERLAEILNRRIEASRIGEGNVPRIRRAHAVTLLRDCDADIRRIEHQLYEEFQIAVERGLPWPNVS